MATAWRVGDTLEELEPSLRALSSSDPSVAVEAFESIERAMRKMLPPMVAPILPPSAVEDIVQEALIKVWLARSRFEFTGVKPWKAYVRRVATHAAIEWLRKGRADQPLDDVEVGAWDSPHDLLDELLQRADEVWFGYPPDLRQGERDRRVLAAQLHLEAGLPWETVCELVNGRPATPADRQSLDEWLEDVAVLRDLSCRALYRTGEQLVGHLLQLREPPELFELAAESLKAAPTDLGDGGWTHAEIVAIVWRYGFGLPEDRIAVHESNRLDLASLSDLFARCERRFPFYESMGRVLRALGERSASVFARQGVFKKLAFQYCYRDELRQKEIQGRIEEPAALAGYRLTPATLTMWLSGRRLVDELSRGMGR